MNVAIIGLPQSGKSTVFSAVTETAFDPVAPREPRTAIVRVPEPRFPYLIDLYHPKKVIHATIELSDIPGSALDDPKGQQEWRRVLPTVRQADLLMIVVRDFENPTVPTYRDRIDARADLAAVWEELIFADLETVTTRVERLELSLKKPTKTHDAEKRELALLTRCGEALESQSPLSSVLHTDEEFRQVAHFAFLTQKPMIVVRNVSDDQAGRTNEWAAEHVEATMAMSASIEAEIAMLDPQDRRAFLEDMGLDAPARDRLIQMCYRAGGLISFLTMGSDEVRAWPIRAGSTAVEAAAKIHTDLAKGFIRAETVAYTDLVEHKDLKGARAVGKVRKEGKVYVVSDGDILNILSSA